MTICSLGKREHHWLFANLDRQQQQQREQQQTNGEWLQVGGYSILRSSENIYIMWVVMRHTTNTTIFAFIFTTSHNYQ